MPASREMKAMSRANIQCLIAGPLTVVRICRKVAKAASSSRVLENGSDPQAGVGGAWRFW